MNEKVTKEHLAALSRSAMAFTMVSSGNDIYQEIATQMRDLVGDSMVTVCSFDPETKVMEQRGLAGIPPAVVRPLERMSRGFTPMRVVANPEAVEQITSGRLVEIEEGVYELFVRKIPRTVARMIERLCSIRAIYGMGCIAEGECFGGITFCLRGDTRLPPIEVIEALVFQAAVAMKRWEAEAELRRSEERYRLLMERAPDPYGVMDADGKLIQVNESACQTLRYTRDALLGIDVSEILDPEELATKPIPWERIRTDPGFVDSRRMKRGDGTFVMFELRSTMLPGGDVLVCARDVTERREVERAAIEAGEKERQAVGRDLHDSLGQELAAIGYLSAALETRLKNQKSSEAESANEIASLVRDAVSRTRRMAHGLNPIDMSEDGILISLELLTAQLRNAGRIDCELSIDGTVSEIPEETAIHLYQISQEATSNAIRHGSPNRIEISLRINGRRGELAIKDDGSGIPVGAEGGTGMGLRAMRFRADLIDGQLDVQSDESGATVLCTFPMPLTNAS